MYAIALLALVITGAASVDNGVSCDDKFKQIVRDVFTREGSVALSMISHDSIPMLRNQMASLSAVNKNKVVVVALDKASYMACKEMSEHCVASRQLKADCKATAMHTAIHDGLARSFEKVSNPFFYIGYMRMYLIGVTLSIPGVILVVLDSDIVFNKKYDPFRFTEPYKLYEWNDMMAFCMTVNGSPLWRYPSSIRRGHRNPIWGQDTHMLNIGHWYLKGNDRTYKAVMYVLNKGMASKFNIQDQMIMGHYLWLNTTSFTCFPDDHYLLEYVSSKFSELATAAELEAMNHVDVLHVQGNPISAKIDEMKRLNMWYID